MLLIWSHADCGHTANLTVSNIRPGEPQMKQRPGLPACAYFIGQSPTHPFGDDSACPAARGRAQYASIRHTACVRKR